MPQSVPLAAAPQHVPSGQSNEQVIGSSYLGELGHGAAQAKEGQDSGYTFDFENKAVPAHLILNVAPTLLFTQTYGVKAHSFTDPPSVRNSEDEQRKKRHIIWSVHGSLPLWTYAEETFDETLRTKREEQEARGKPYFWAEDCILCLEADPTFAFLPCRHVCVHTPETVGCQMKLEVLHDRKGFNCYVCRAHVTAGIRVAALKPLEV